MTTAAWVALGITIFGALSYATASILQAIGARRSVGTVRTMGHPLYLLGIACDMLAWLGAMVALLGPLMIIVMGAVVLLIVIAMLMPIIQLNDLVTR